MPPIRLRLSNGVTAATEFTADSPRTLRAGVEEAYTRHVADYPEDRARTLELQVAPPAGADALGWAVPMRRADGAHPSNLGTPVRVLVSRELLDRRPLDDWGDIWDWCLATQHADAEIARLRGWAHDGRTPRDTSSAD